MIGVCPARQQPGGVAGQVVDLRHTVHAQCLLHVACPLGAATGRAEARRGEGAQVGASLHLEGVRTRHSLIRTLEEYEELAGTKANNQTPT